MSTASPGAALSRACSHHFIEIGAESFDGHHAIEILLDDRGGFSVCDHLLHRSADRFRQRGVRLTFVSSTEEKNRGPPHSLDRHE